MSKAREAGAQGAALSFPNPSRSYDEERLGIHFWGYDRTFEIAFFIDRSALSKVDPVSETGESCALRTFDENRDRICAAAVDIYKRRPRGSQVRAYVLQASSF